jgi:hypothetical protein
MNPRPLAEDPESFERSGVEKALKSSDVTTGYERSDARGCCEGSAQAETQNGGIGGSPPPRQARRRDDELINAVIASPAGNQRGEAISRFLLVRATRPLTVAPLP